MIKEIKNNKLSGIDPQSIREFYIQQDYKFFNPNMTIPANVVMNFMGEDVRNRLLFTDAPDGEELCLRPDFTLPLALNYLNNQVSTHKFVYDGYAFRFPSDNEETRSCPEFRQIGIENFGSLEKIKTEVEIISQTYDILSKLCNFELEIKISDISLFFQLLSHLELDSFLTNKIKRLYWQGQGGKEIKKSLENIIKRKFDTKIDIKIIESYKKGKLTNLEFIKEFTGYDDLSIYSNRTPEQIVTNFINKYDSNYIGELNISNLDIILEFLSLDGDLQSTIENLHKFQNKYKLDLSKGIIDFEDRLEKLEKSNVELNNIKFNATLSRKVEYYTGLIFQISNKNSQTIDPLAIGGRYDKIFEELGSHEPIPSVGCSIYIDRLLHEEVSNEK